DPTSAPTALSEDVALEQTAVRTLPAWLAATAIGFTTALLVYWTTADRLALTNDEGIFLSSGLAVLHGTVPYRDFFAHTGPVTFWLLAAIFRVMGVTLRHAHLLVSLDLGVIIGVTWWLASQLTNRRIALGCSTLCAAIFLSSPTNVLINHRWDSNAFA